MGKGRLRLGWGLPAFVILAAFPATAHAHTTIQGLGEVVNGLIHPVTTPSHLLVLVGLGLLLGQQPSPKLKTPMLVFLPLSAAGLLLTLTGWINAVHPPILVSIALAAGTLVALERTPPRWVGTALLAGAGVAIGLDSAVEAETTIAQLKTLFGTWLCLGLLLFDVAYYASFWTRKKWQKIGLRIIGSWLIAISLMVLAFSLRT